MSGSIIHTIDVPDSRYREQARSHRECGAFMICLKEKNHAFGSVRIE